MRRRCSGHRVATVNGGIRTLTDQLIDAVRARGSCEFMSEIAEVLPVQVFLKMLGLPLERQGEYRALTKQYLEDISSGNLMKGMTNAQLVVAAMRDTMLDRRDHPQEDILSALWRIEIDGKSTTLEDKENYGVLLIIAGLDAVMNGMGHGVRHLAQDLTLQRELRHNPKAISEAKEELLRRYTFTVPTRVLGKDAVFEGLPMKKGEHALLFLPAADLGQ